MRSQFVIGLVIVAMFAATQAQDVESLLMNRYYVKKQVDCVLERGSCDSIGIYLKNIVSDALNNGCSTCTPEKLQILKRVRSIMETKYPQEWSEILAAYGGNGNNRG